MSELPDHIAARRTQARAQRRRARRRALGAAVALVSAAAAVTVVVTASGAGSKPHGAQHASVDTAPVSPPAKVRPLSGQELRAVRRLITFGLPVYCGGDRGNEVALTFDDGPGVYTHYALKKLTEAHERATFFVVGKSILAWPGWLRRELKVAALGDHTFNHLDLVEMPPAQAYQEIARAKQLIERDTGQPVVLFRPPYEAHDAAVDAIVRRLGLLDVLWSVDSADSLGANYAGIIRNVEQGLRPGAIIEMHENRGQTIRALTTLLPVLARRHLRSVSLLQLLTSDPPSPSQLRRGEAACGEPSETPGRGSE